MSLDEVAQMHERLGLRSDRLLPSGTRAGGLFPYTGIWMFVIGIPVLLLFFVAIRSAATSSAPSSGEAFARIAIGLSLTALGAMLFDLIGNLMFYRRGSPFPSVEETSSCSEQPSSCGAASTCCAHTGCGSAFTPAKETSKSVLRCVRRSYR